MADNIQSTFEFLSERLQSILESTSELINEQLKVQTSSAASLRNIDESTQSTQARGSSRQRPFIVSPSGYITPPDHQTQPSGGTDGGRGFFNQLMPMLMRLVGLRPGGFAQPPQAGNSYQRRFDQRVQSGAGFGQTPPPTQPPGTGQPGALTPKNYPLTDPRNINTQGPPGKVQGKSGTIFDKMDQVLGSVYKGFEKVNQFSNQKQSEFTSRFGNLEKAAQSSFMKSLGLDKAADKAITVGKAVQGDPKAIVKLVKEEIQERAQHAQLSAQSFTRAFATTDEGLRSGRIGSPERVGADLLRGTSHAARTTMGPAAMPVQAMNKFGEVILSSINKLRDWVDSLHNVNMRFGEFSSAMASVAAESEMRQIQLESDRGERRAGTARELAEARDQMDRNMAGFGDAMGNIQNRMGTFFTQLGNSFMEVTGLNRFGDWLAQATSSDNRGPGPASWMTQTNQETWMAEYGRPIRFGPHDED